MATVQSYTKAGVDQKLADRSYRVLPHPGGGTPNLASYPDAKSGDVIERNSDGARWSVLAGTLNPETGRVVSVAGKTGIVTLGPTDVGAAPTSHTHTKAQITDLNASTAATANSIAQRTTNGRLVVGTPTASTDATTKAYVDQQVAIPQAWAVITGKPSVYPPDTHTHTKAQITDLNASTAATANTIAQRTTGGRLVVGTPTSSTDAATKAYVDTAATNASKWASITGKPVTVSDTISTSNAGAYVVLNSGGRISAVTPTQDSDVANKAYVDAKTWTIDNISDITVSASATANTVAQRTSGGRLLVGTPTGTTDATTKAYVDSAVTASKAWANLTGKPSTFPPSTHTHTVSQITDLTLNTSSVANTVPIRNSSGVFSVAEPTSDSHAASRGYVNAKVAEPVMSTLLTTEDLNDIESPGNYLQNTNTNASVDRNYPINLRAGHLIVARGQSFVSQEYTDYLNDYKFVRTKSVNGWRPWKTIADKTYVDSEVTASKAWSAITGKPSTFTPSTHSHTIAQITDLTVAVADDPETVVKRDNLGRVNVSAPAWDSHAATKKYVDDKVGAPVSWGNLTGIPSTFTPSSHTHTIAQITDLTVATTATANTVAKRTTGGRLVVGTPSATSEATTKAYVDSAVTASKAWANLTGKPSTFPPSSHTHTVSQITDLTLNASAVANTVPIRNSSGVFSVADPTSDSHPTNRAYVNSAITDAKKWANLTDKPTSFPPSTHNHTSSQITDKVSGVWSNNTGDNRVIATSGGGYIQTSKTPVSSVDVVNKLYVDTRPALFKGASLPPTSIPGARVGDSWLDTRNMRLYDITGT